MRLTQTMNQFTEAINAASVAGPVVLLGLALLVLSAVIGIVSWKLMPILNSLANRTPEQLAVNNQALADVKEQVVTSNQVNNANASAVGELAKNIADMTAALTSGHERLNANDEQRSANQAALTNAVAQMADATRSLNQAMEKSIEFEKNRHLSLIGGISQVVTSIGDLSKALQDDLEALRVLIESRPRALDAEGVGWFRSHIQAIHDCVLRMEVVLGTAPGTPLLVTVPPGTVAFDVQIEGKEKEQVQP